MVIWHLFQSLGWTFDMEVFSDNRYIGAKRFCEDLWKITLYLPFVLVRVAAPQTSLIGCCKRLCFISRQLCPTKSRQRDLESYLRHANSPFSMGLSVFYLRVYIWDKFPVVRANTHHFGRLLSRVQCLLQSRETKLRTTSRIKIMGLASESPTTFPLPGLNAWPISSLGTEKKV